MGSPERDVTQLLVDWSHGDESAFAQLTPLIYDELRRLARSHLRRERAGHTLQTTELVHEAYLRIVDQRRVRWQNRAQFYAIAAQMIRRILVDRARSRQAQKRGAARPRLSLDEAGPVAERQDLDLVALDEALEGLSKLDPQQSRIVELRFFAGLSVEETAEVLQISPATLKRQWTTARAWLLRELSGHRPPAHDA